MRVGYRFHDLDCQMMVNAVDDATSLPLLQFVARSSGETRSSPPYITASRLRIDGRGRICLFAMQMAFFMDRPRSNEDSTIAFTQIGTPEEHGAFVRKRNY